MEEVDEIILRWSKERRGLNPCSGVSGMYKEKPANSFYTKELSPVYTAYFHNLGDKTIRWRLNRHGYPIHGENVVP